MSTQFQQRLITAIIAGLRDSRDQMFTQSQSEAPVDRGTLKKSGYSKNLPNGAEFGYRVPYAAAQNWGTGAGWQWVHYHNRQARSHTPTWWSKGGTPSSRRHGIYKRPHTISAYSRYMPAQPARLYVTTPFLNNLPNIPVNIARRIRMEFP